MPPVFVTCYICGRDFGSRSIGIHLPNCQKKWEAAQEKLPKKERRPLPTAPENFDKVVSGEIKGKDLVKMNQKAFDDYNETALESCQFCGRYYDIYNERKKVKTRYISEHFFLKPWSLTEKPVQKKVLC